ncbi:MAG: ABC transporter permease subunit/CPBP intramembrane protease [Planctomycetota bacterium]
MSDLPTAAVPQPRASLFRRLTRLARKELRESLRDRRTLATLVLMPLIVYPLLGMVIQKFAISRASGQKAPEAIVLYHDLLPMQEAALLLRELDEPPASPVASPAQPSAGGLPQLPDGFPGTSLPLLPQIRIEAQPFSAAQIESAVRQGAADAGVLLVPGAAEGDRSGPVPDQLQVICRAGEPLSENTAAELERRLRENRDSLIRGLLDQTRFGRAAFPYVRRLSLASTAPAESPLAAFVPLMLVLMTMTGAVYPAIDLTAGERERGTLEMLMAAPVPPQQILLGKFAAVFFVAVMTALVNLTGMMITLYGTGFDRVLLAGGAGPLMLAQVLLMLVVFAAFFSAVLLSVTSFARSFREAQAWLIPLMLVSLAPGILSLMPGVRLTFPLSLVPLVNIVLLGRELFQGTATLPLFAATILATTAWSAAALTLAARIFGSDAVLHSAPAPLRSDHGGRTPRTLPPALVASCSTVLFPLFIIISMSRHRLVDPANTTAQLLLSAAILTGLLIGLPLIFLRLAGLPTLASFSVRPFRPRMLVAALLLGLSAWTAVYELLILANGLSGWSRFLENPAIREMLDRLLRQSSLPLQLFCLAVVPAVAEELFFRGFLLNGLLARSRSQTTPLLISSLLFAAAHLIPDLAIERFPGTLLLGLLLGLVRLRSGSVLPGMLLHAVNNGLLLSLASLQPVLLLAGINLNLENESHLPLQLLVPAGVLLLTGALLLFGAPRQSSGNRHERMGSETGL